MYRVLLLSYQAGNFITSDTLQIRDTDIDAIRKNHPALNAYLGKKDLQITGLTLQLDNLRNMEQQKLNVDLMNTTANEDADRINALHLLKDDIDKTVTALYRLIKKIEYIKIDYEVETIIDLSNMNLEMVDKNLMKPFFRHLKMSTLIPHKELTNE